MATSASLDQLLQSLRLAWLRGCAASARQCLAAHQRWTMACADGSRQPRRLVVRAPGRPDAAAPAAAFDLAALCDPVWLRPAALSLSFACELRARPDGAWQLQLVDRGRDWWWNRAPRHEVEIVIDGAFDAGGELRFDGQLWRRFGANEDRPR